MRKSFFFDDLQKNLYQLMLSVRIRKYQNNFNFRFMKHVTMIFLLGMIFFSCQKDELPVLVCGVEDPVEDLDWLNEQIRELEGSDFGAFQYFTQAKSGNQDIFILKNCCSNCNSVYPIYDCQGNELGSVGDSRFPMSAISDEKVIWKSSNSLCNV